MKSSASEWEKHQNNFFLAKSLLHCKTKTADELFQNKLAAFN